MINILSTTFLNLENQPQNKSWKFLGSRWWHRRVFNSWTHRIYNYLGDNSLWKKSGNELSNSYTSEGEKSHTEVVGRGWATILSQTLPLAQQHRIKWKPPASPEKQGVWMPQLATSTWDRGPQMSSFEANSAWIHETCKAMGNSWFLKGPCKLIMAKPQGPEQIANRHSLSLSVKEVYLFILKLWSKGQASNLTHILGPTAILPRDWEASGSHFCTLLLLHAAGISLKLKDAFSLEGKLWQT